MSRLLPTTAMFRMGLAQTPYKITRGIEFSRIARGHGGDIERVAIGRVVAKQRFAQVDGAVMRLLLQRLPCLSQHVVLAFVGRRTVHISSIAPRWEAARKGRFPLS